MRVHLLNISSISNSSQTYSVGNLSSVTSSSKTSSTNGAAKDSSATSELATLMKQLESLEKTDPAKFKEISAEVANKLEEAAKTAADNGDSQNAGALNDMAAKFTTASETGKMPDLRGGGGPPPMGPPPDTSSTSSSSTDDSSTSTSLNVKDLLSLFQQGSTTDPFSTLTSILDSALSSEQS
jgi:hypothetical protein